MRQRKEKGLQSTTWKYLRRSKKKRHNVPDSHQALHMHVLERDFSIRAACVQHDCATCASMQRDAVTAAQSRFLATWRWRLSRLSSSLRPAALAHQPGSRSSALRQNLRCHTPLSWGGCGAALGFRSFAPPWCASAGRANMSGEMSVAPH